MNRKDLYELGERCSIASTIADDFVPWKAEGVDIYGTLVNRDISGWFLDFSSSYAVFPLDYGNQAIRNAITKQMNTGLWHYPSHDWHSDAPVSLKEKLVNIAPISGEKKVFLCNSGTEAIEAAIKLCQARRAKETGGLYTFHGFLAFQGSFHGRTLGALSLTSSKKIHRDGFSTINTVYHLPFPEKNNQKSISDFEKNIEHLSSKFLNNVNALFLELVQGESGINVIDSGSLDKIVSICRQNGIHVVVDEIQTGLMRTGKMFACEHFGLEPDIICLAKALGGGLPLGAAVAKSEFQLQPGQHSSTFGGSPVACSASLAFFSELEKINKNELEEKIKILEEFAPEGLGMMRRIVFPTSEKRNWVVDEALKNRLIVIKAGDRSIRLMPQLTMTKEDLLYGINLLKEIISKIPT